MAPVPVIMIVMMMMSYQLHVSQPPVSIVLLKQYWTLHVALGSHQFSLNSYSILVPCLAISLDRLIQGTQVIVGLSTLALVMLFFAMPAGYSHCLAQEELEKHLRVDISMQLEEMAFWRSMTNVMHTKVAMVAWGNYKQNRRHGATIEERLDNTRNTQIQHNRHYIKTVANVILLCARQDLALRAHDESQSSQNKGNFLEILHLIAQHDEIVRERLTAFGCRNASYTSPAIQNMILHILADIVKKL